MSIEHRINNKYVSEVRPSRVLKQAIGDVIALNPELAIVYQQELFKIATAEAVHKLRTDKGFTQNQLASEAGLTQPMISVIENPDAEKTPQVDTLAKIAFACGKRLTIGFID
jgi:DNA-binding XRE family transcriptional regulator